MTEIVRGIFRCCSTMTAGPTGKGEVELGEVVHSCIVMETDCRRDDKTSDNVTLDFE